MAWAHKEPGLRQPPHRTAEMGTVDCKRDEALGVQTAQPGGGQRGHARPSHGRGIFKAHFNGLPDLEIVYRTYSAPDGLLGLNQRTNDEPDDRDADHSRGDRGERDAEPSEEAAALGAQSLAANCRTWIIFIAHVADSSVRPGFRSDSSPRKSSPIHLPIDQTISTRPAPENTYELTIPKSRKVMPSARNAGANVASGTFSGSGSTHSCVSCMRGDSDCCSEAIAESPSVLINKLRKRGCHPEPASNARRVEGSRAAFFCRVISCAARKKHHHGRKRWRPRDPSPWGGLYKDICGASH